MWSGRRRGLRSVSALTRENSSASSKESRRQTSDFGPQTSDLGQKTRDDLRFPSQIRNLRSEVRRLSVRRLLFPNLLPGLDRASPRRLCDPAAGSPSHVHDFHASLEIIGQRPPHFFELLWILRRQHRQAHTRRQHARRISFSYEQNRCRPDGTHDHCLFPAIHSFPQTKVTSWIVPAPAS